MNSVLITSFGRLRVCLSAYSSAKLGLSMAERFGQYKRRNASKGCSRFFAFTSGARWPLGGTGQVFWAKGQVFWAKRAPDLAKSP